MTEVIKIENCYQQQCTMLVNVWKDTIQLEVFTHVPDKSAYLNKEQLEYLISKLTEIHKNMD